MPSLRKIHRGSRRFMRCLKGFPQRAGFPGTSGGAGRRCSMHGELNPFTFHANWTTRLNNKRALMAQAGTWLLND